MGAVVAALPAAAQEPHPSRDGQPVRGGDARQGAMLDELVVTAQKRQESLQDVPIAVTAISADRRDLIGALGTQGLVNLTPNMAFGSGGITLRGIGRVTGQFGTDPAVALYFDGVYVTDPGYINLPTFMLDSTEILRGPQGTLFGRNSLGGAVLQTSKRPTETFEGEVFVSVANYRQLDAGARVSGPITEDLLGQFAFAYIKGQRKGFTPNVAGKDANTTENPWFEGQLTYRPTGNIEIWGKYSVAWLNNTAGAAAFNHSDRPYVTTNPLLFGLVPSPYFGYQTPNPGVTDIRTHNINYPGKVVQPVPTHTGTLHLDLDLGRTTLKYIGGITKYKADVTLDYDGISRSGYTLPYTGPCPTGSCPYPDGAFFVSADSRLLTNQKALLWSHELNWTSNDDSRLQWILGLFTYKENNASPVDIGLPLQPELATADFPLGSFLQQYADLDAASYAVFGQAGYALTEQLRVTVGLRYSWEHKVGLESQTFRAWNPNAFGTSAPIVLASTSRTLTGDWEGWSGRLAVDFQPDDDTLLYGSISRGWKAGGFALLSFIPGDPYVRSETVVAYELGLKKSLTNELTVNSAVFYNDYRNQQAGVNQDVGILNGGTPTGQTVSRLLNVPQARTYGFETEVSYVPTERLQFNLVYSFLDAEYVDFQNVVNSTLAPPRAVDLSGATLKQSPRNKFAINTIYTMEFADGSLDLSATYAWIDEQYSNIFNTDLSRVPDYSDLNLRATWTDARRRYRASAWVTNALDDLRISSVGSSDALSPLPGFRVGPSYSFQPPRVFGMDLRVYF